MHYDHIPIPHHTQPRAVAPAYQHLVETYASETNKTAAVWRIFADGDLGWRPHPRSSTVEEIMNFHEEIVEQVRSRWAS